MLIQRQQLEVALHHADRKARETNLRTRTRPLGTEREHINLHLDLFSDGFCVSTLSQSPLTPVATRLLLAQLF